MASLDGRVVAVTGASAGIGQALTRRLVAGGAHVVALARRADRLESLRAESAGRRGSILAVQGDVTREQDLQQMIDRAVDAFGQLDVLVCNAGIGFHGTLEATPADVVRRIVDVNLLGTVFAARTALPVMRRQGRGHIIAVASIVARRGVEGSAVYSASKAAQLAFIESLRAEFVGTGLHASVVLPVSTTSEFHAAISRDYGQTVRGHGPKQSADQVAASIVRCIERPRAEVYPYRWAKMLAVVSAIAPAQADRLVRRFRRSSTARDHAAPTA